MEDLEFLSHTTGKTFPEAGVIDRSVLRLAEAMARKAKMYEHPEEFVRLPMDPSLYTETISMVEKVWTTNLKYVVVIGIGGSNLGAQAVYAAVRGTWGDYDDHTNPRAMFFDACEPRKLEEGIEFLERHVTDAHEVVINIISKSGTTTESLVNADAIVSRLSSFIPQIHTRIVITTDHGSALASLAARQKLQVLPIPKVIGGRFSVFTPVGLFPLGLLGVDLKTFRDGAKEVYESAIHNKDMHARRAAEAIFQAYQRGETTYNLFYFHPEMEMLGKWSRQLIAESLGKEFTLDGKGGHVGILPIVSIGSTDLHSQLQLYLAGPTNIFTTFVRTKNFRAVRSAAGMFSALTEMNIRSAKDVTEAVYAAVLDSFRKHNRSYSEIVLPDNPAYAVGVYMAWLTTVVYFLSALLHVNPFDQPNVEDYKKTTKEYLATANKKTL